MGRSCYKLRNAHVSCTYCTSLIEELRERVQQTTSSTAWHCTNTTDFAVMTSETTRSHIKRQEGLYKSYARDKAKDANKDAIELFWSIFADSRSPVLAVSTLPWLVNSLLKGSIPTLKCVAFSIFSKTNGLKFRYFMIFIEFLAGQWNEKSRKQKKEMKWKKKKIGGKHIQCPLAYRAKIVLI